MFKFNHDDNDDNDHESSSSYIYIRFYSSSPPWRDLSHELSKLRRCARRHVRLVRLADLPDRPVLQLGDRGGLERKVLQRCGRQRHVAGSERYALCGCVSIQRLELIRSEACGSDHYGDPATHSRLDVQLALARVRVVDEHVGRPVVERGIDAGHHRNATGLHTDRAARVEARGGASDGRVQDKAGIGEDCLEQAAADAASAPRETDPQRRRGRSSSSRGSSSSSSSSRGSRGSSSLRGSLRRAAAAAAAAAGAGLKVR
jgi:hypothetical protein